MCFSVPYSPYNFWRLYSIPSHARTLVNLVRPPSVVISYPRDYLPCKLLSRNFGWHCQDSKALVQTPRLSHHSWSLSGTSGEKDLVKLGPTHEWLSGSSLLSSGLKDPSLVGRVIREIEKFNSTKKEIFALVGTLLDAPSVGCMPTTQFTSVQFVT